VLKRSGPRSRQGQQVLKRDIKVLLAHNNRILREGLLHMFRGEEGIRVIGEAEDGKELVRMAKELNPEVVIMESALSGGGGSQAIKEILAQSPTTRIIVLSMFADRSSVLGMIRAGSAGCLLRDCSFDELVRAVRTVGTGHTYMSSGIMGLVVEDYFSRVGRSEAVSSPVLTAKEIEVLRFIADGKSIREIASGLGVSSKTIESHRRQIMERLNLSSVAALVKYAIREGLTFL
jgi:two-component system response regulator NreC